MVAELMKALRQSVLKYLFGDGSRIRSRANPSSILAYCYWPNSRLTFFKIRKVLGAALIPTEKTSSQQNSFLQRMNGPK